jgi:hypothetical protein
MYKFKSTFIVAVVTFALFIVLGTMQELTAQLKLPRPSPGAEVTQTIGQTVVKVDYSRPGVKGREIWGKLVPYNEVWRAGANEATTISFSTDVTINGQKLAAGTYSFFVLPTAAEWTVIFNSEPKQWGAFSYKKEKDVLRVSVKPEASTHQEWMSYNFEDLKGKTCRFLLRWEKLAAGVVLEGLAAKDDRPSPAASVLQTVTMTDISVLYSRPGVKGREIWGKLVPFGEVWRAGANEATAVSFSDDVLINGQKLPAGTYTFFIVPTEKEWALIFNGEPKQWGAFSYKKEKDVLKLTLTPESAPQQEWLEYSVEPVKNNNAVLGLTWANLKADVNIEVDTTPAFIWSKVQAQVKAKMDDATILSQGARYALNTKQNLDVAMTWAQKSVSIKKMYGNLRTTAELFAQAGKYPDAVKTGEEAIKVGKEADPKLDTTTFEKLMADWKTKK